MPADSICLDLDLNEALAEPLRRMVDWSAADAQPVFWLIGAKHHLPADLLESAESLLAEVPESYSVRARRYYWDLASGADELAWRALGFLVDDARALRFRRILTGQDRNPLDEVYKRADVHPDDEGLIASTALGGTHRDFVLGQFDVEVSRSVPATNSTYWLTPMIMGRPSCRVRLDPLRFAPRGQLSRVFYAMIVYGPPLDWTRIGFRTRSGSIMNPQSFGRMLTNRLYTAFIDMPHFGVSRRGDFDPLVSDETFYRVQAILQGRIKVVGPHQRVRPDFPLKGLVRCADCGRPLTASWSKGRSGRYAYYHCWRQCRAVNVTKAKLEGLFTDELERLQPTPGYMRLVKDLVLRAWHERKAVVGRDAADAERKAKTIQQKLDRLDEAFIYAKAIDLATYERQRDRLRQELTLTQIDRHSVELDKFDVEGILAFAERVLPSASDLWVQASLNQKQRLQQLFLPGRDCIRRKTICSNRRNHARVQLLNVRRRV